MSFPKTIFIYRDDNENLLCVAEKLDDIDVERSKRELIGEYELKRNVEVVTETTIVTEVG